MFFKRCLHEVVKSWSGFYFRCSHNILQTNLETSYRHREDLLVPPRRKIYFKKPLKLYQEKWKQLELLKTVLILFSANIEKLFKNKIQGKEKEKNI